MWQTRENGLPPTRHPPRVPEGSRVYAVGDVHGQLDQLERLQQAILADAEAHPSARRVVVYLGDYIDRGPAAKPVVDRLLTAPLPGFESVHLMGNHEEFLLRFLDEPGVGRVWLMNGGDATCLSYGVDPWSVAERRDRWPALSHLLGERLDAAHRAFYRDLALFHVEGDYAFVHAGVRPGLPLERQSSADLLWIREDFLLSSADHGRVIVHGHTPSGAPERHANRIGIDTGAVYGGPLTALVLDGARQGFLQA